MFEQLSLNIKSLYDPSGTDKFIRHLKEAKREMSSFKSMAGQINRAKNGIRTTGEELAKVSKELRRFKFEWLSVMFFGMAMEKAFGGILRAAFKTWSNFTEGTDQASGAMTQLQAGWEYFKYSLFDALLNSSLFNSFVGFVLKLVEWWGDLSDSSKSFVANVIAAGAVIGTALAAAGTIKLGFGGLSSILGEAENLKKNLAGILGVVLIGVAIKTGADAFKEIREGKWVTGVLDAMAAAFLGIAGAQFLVNGKAGPLLYLGIALKFISSDAFWTAARVLASGIAAFFQTMWDKIAWGFNTSITNVIKETLQEIADTLRTIPFFKPLANLIDSASNALLPDAQTFDEWGNFMNHFVENMDTSSGINWDSINQAFMQATGLQAMYANAVAQNQGVASFPDQINVNVVNWQDAPTYTPGYTPVPQSSSQRDGYSYYGAQ